ncbi:MAG: hypothetical protein ACJ8AW_34615 [Rhodopila sp.]
MLRGARVEQQGVTMIRSNPVKRLAARSRSKEFPTIGEAHVTAADRLLTDWEGDRRRFGGSGGNGRLRVRIIAGLESLSEAGTERSIVDGATNREQKIGSSSRPAHLL